MDFIKLFIPTFIYVFAVDCLWLGVIAKNLYRDALGPLLKEPFNLYAAGLVYVAITCGILLFSLPKTDGTYLSAVIWGGALGLIMYALYDYTNLAILKDWPLTISLIDIVWGGVLCALTTCFAMFIRGYVN